MLDVCSPFISHLFSFDANPFGGTDSVELDVTSGILRLETKIHFNEMNLPKESVGSVESVVQIRYHYEESSLRTAICASSQTLPKLISRLIIAKLIDGFHSAASSSAREIQIR